MAPAGRSLDQLLQNSLVALAGEQRAQGGGIHPVVRLGKCLEQDPGEMGPRALPAAALQRPAIGIGEGLVNRADHELDPSEGRLFQRYDELDPELIGLDIADHGDEQLPPAIRIEPMATETAVE
jgi:hypothetical protein